MLVRPHSRYVGLKITVDGDFWPGSSNAERAQSFVLTIADADEKHRFPRDSTNHVAFKVVLEMADDRNGTAPSEQEEGVHYWWVPREAVERHILEAVRKKASDVAAAASAAAAVVATVAAAAAPPTTARRRPLLRRLRPAFTTPPTSPQRRRRTPPARSLSKS